MREDSSQQQKEEGFIPNKYWNHIEYYIQPKELITNQRPKDFKARVLGADAPIKKQPLECYSRFSHLPSQSLIIDNNSTERDSLPRNRKKDNNKPDISFKQFLNPNKYQLVYQRFPNQKNKLPSSNTQEEDTFLQEYFGKNQVNLQCSILYQEKNYTLLKQFQNHISRPHQQAQKPTHQQTYKPTHKQTHKDAQQDRHHQNTLVFDSKFQSGNLLYAFQDKENLNSYSLFLQNDTNTHGYNQWFYFSIQNVHKNITYKISLLNFRKKFSFFKQGMMPTIFSLKDAKFGSGWSRKYISNVSYGPSAFITTSNGSQQKQYSLQFELNHIHDEDYISISMGVPYSYSRLIHQLKTIKQYSYRNDVKFQIKTIAYTLANNAVPMLTITKDTQITSDSKLIQKVIYQVSHKSNVITSTKPNAITSTKPNAITSTKKKSSKLTHQANSSKKIIILMARQHPGETWSSFFIQQFIYQLVKNETAESDWLLSNFQFKIFPMVNIDGVIYGNFRCDLSGCDMNRNWKFPSKLLHPQLFSIKQQITILQKTNKIVLCFDFHGHSKQYNIFSYGCKTDDLQCRKLPYMFQKLNPNFYFPFCTYGLSKYKESTARAVISDIIKNINVITIQTSFYGSKNVLANKSQVKSSTQTLFAVTLQEEVGQKEAQVGQKEAQRQQIKAFEPATFTKMSSIIIKSLKSYFSQDEFKKTCEDELINKLDNYIKYAKINWEEVSGSDSNPSADQIDMKVKFGKILPLNIVKELAHSQLSRKRSILNSSFIHDSNTASKNHIFTDKSEDKLLLSRKNSKPNIIVKRQNYIEKEKRQTMHLKTNVEIIQIADQIKKPFPQISRRTLNQEVNLQKRPINTKQYRNNIKSRFNTEHHKEHKVNLHNNSSSQEIQQISTKFKSSFKSSMKKIYRFLRDKPQSIAQTITNSQKTIFSQENSIKIQPKGTAPPQKRTSNIQKILRMRKRANTFKKIEIQSADKSLTKEQKKRKYVFLQVNSDYKAQQQKNNSYLQDRAQQKEKEETLNHEKKKQTTKSSQKIENPNNKSIEIIAKIWRQNFIKYEKQLRFRKIS